MQKIVDCADIVKQSVSMPEILTAYGLETNRSGRIPCPIHSGVKKNFAYKRDFFKCYVCGAGGSVIDFVMDYRGLRFIDALREINAMFGLRLPLEDGEETPEFVLREAALRRERKREREKRRTALLRAYHEALDAYAALDIILMEDAPEGPLEPYSDKYVYAAKHIDAAWHKVQESEGALHEFETQERQKCRG